MRQHYNSGIFHTITKLGNSETGEIFKVFIKIPFSFGWIERVNFSIQNFNQKNLYQMQHIENRNEYAHFEVIVVIKSCSLYHYHFSFIANGKFQYYKKYHLAIELYNLINRFQ